jgi:NADH:ubiquinone oxidoreductase subunit 5 (subunit L)/multisubunit Na+/H+ antiporter MnhA subunit
MWLSSGVDALDQKDFVLYEHAEYSFLVDFYFDKITATYALVGAFLIFLVTLYSKVYMHREEGYKRFFSTLQFFFLGYNLTIFSGNFETLFIGWEILGISSFLLIAYYRNRYLPVKNAVKVFSIYRIGDVGILLAMWLSHHFWHENITFNKLNHHLLWSDHLAHPSFVGLVIALLILVTAAAKSAQLPFSSWLPRAMEGPTPSSAIFYGSLAVHIGVFLLLRTSHFWESQMVVRWIIGILGLVTAVLAYGMARVQASIKSQIAYSSITQIGIMFIEISLGWYDWVLFHFAGNAFLRTYQLLVSPSVVTYLIKEQFYNFKPRTKTLEDSMPKKWEYSLYLLSLKEFQLDSFMYQYLWNPAKWLGRKLQFLQNRWLWIFVLVIYILGWILRSNENQLPAVWVHSLPLLFSLMAIVLVLKAFTERKKAIWSWLMIMMNHGMVAMAISFNEHFTMSHIVLYLSGILIAGLFGWYLLLRLKKLGEIVDLNQFHGNVKGHPKLTFVFFLTCLGLTGFPLTPTFLGEDLIFSHIHEDQILLAFFTALSFVLDGIAVIRIYARVCLGPHSKSIFEMGYRSS